MLYIDGEYQASVSGYLLLGEIRLEDVLGRIGAALLVHRPGVGVIATAHDAKVAGDVVDLGVRRNDGEPVDLSLECHSSILPQSTFDRRP
jgi:hypothetical protein